MPTVRLFAAASEAAATSQTAVPATTVAELRQQLVASFGPEFERVLHQCSLMIDGRRASDGDGIEESALVDVLPPFAGG